ncbi:DUF2268 domain-containing protein [Bacillus vallismortis]|uniref:DUF2268 domain-containing protein n=1 Tax=Bacillus vallismortis TaxID=72361 RepID=UPI00228174CB|nr:DUF2268 domain-containing protein [Bacillus vallismortis]MCI3984589.1 DUF2268 domain-containing protein [Bacillus vallismortis]MCI4135884.1 DUF2268 domain-containing protein [Bacillus vallismortis]MCY7893027.1 DUF2268 domain-containing protein [Bacillus vallismortis]
MSVEQTYSWLSQAVSINDLAHYIVPLFSGVEKKDWKGILGHLQHHGMFKNIKEGSDTASKLKEKGFYEHIQKEEQYLKNKWKGPDVPIVTLPVDVRNRTIRLEFGSKSGLAFQDKMFLFLSSELDFASVSALMTHEYHHVCRLDHLTKEEKDVTLLDTIIMEGLAEYAVYERFGRNQTAEWTSWYTEKQLQALYEKKIAPNLDIKRENRLFSQLLFGKGYHPKMLGYAVGFNIVKKYLTANKANTADGLSIPAETFLNATL